ncbi:MAG: hypothetical protein EHM28_01640 [Spirochaetaceae bacterium]|nr:MAG: hypothetical protein EHM28_01640 [Spirochaetaceae bacterium]
MLHLNTLTDDDARHAIKHNEFDTGIIAMAKNVLVILSQNWCSQWQYLKSDLEKHITTGEADIHVHIFLYNRSPLFQEFMDFKEKVFVNDQTPYMRFYRDGKLFFESNFLPLESIIRKFTS